MKNRILRKLDRAYLRFTNLFRDTKLGYIEKYGTIHFNEGGKPVFKDWHISGLSGSIGLELRSGHPIKLGGWNTGVIYTPEP